MADQEPAYNEQADPRRSPLFLELTRLWQRLQADVDRQWHRTLPLGDYLIDRREKARLLGFGEGTSIYDSAIVIGAARCGTTSLYEHLKAHPGLYVPPQKRQEPHFFLREAEYGRGLAYYSDTYFRDAPPSQAAGEISASYVYQPWAFCRTVTLPLYPQMNNSDVDIVMNTLKDAIWRQRT